MRKPVDRIGYGGYLSLAYKFPKFVDYIAQVTDEFREIYDNIGGSRPYCGLKVAVLNCWGQIRAWQAFMVAHALWYKQTYSYFGMLESLSGASVDVVFLSFDEIKEKGILRILTLSSTPGRRVRLFPAARRGWTTGL